MGKSKDIPNGMSMPVGMMLGFLGANLNKVPEEKLRHEIDNIGHLMLSWLDDGTSAE